MGTEESSIQAENAELVGMYWQQALSEPTIMYDVAGSSDALDSYGWSSSWRAIDDAESSVYLGEDPENEGTWLFAYFPDVFILETATMKIVKTQDIDGDIDVPAEVAALNN